MLQIKLISEYMHRQNGGFEIKMTHCIWLQSPQSLYAGNHCFDCGWCINLGCWLYFKRHNLFHLLHKKDKPSDLSGEEKALSLSNLLFVGVKKVDSGIICCNCSNAVAGVVLLFWIAMLVFTYVSGPCLPLQHANSTIWNWFSSIIKMVRLQVALNICSQLCISHQIQFYVEYPVALRQLIRSHLWFSSACFGTETATALLFRTFPMWTFPIFPMCLFTCRTEWAWHRNLCQILRLITCFHSIGCDARGKQWIHTGYWFPTETG